MSDPIERQAAIDAASYECHELRGVFEQIEERLKALPSAQPDPQECEKCIFKSFKQFQPAQRTGRWIWDDEGYHCSECFYHAYGNNSEIYLGEFKFCPNCGCAMEGEEE